jgi:SagB-type dehydrogenase family enzyme
MYSYMKKYLLCSCIILCLEQFPNSGQDIVLPEPRKDGGIPLMEAINKRKSTRDFSSYDISEQVLSDMLWAAYGFNRPQENKRTVPSAYNIQNMKIYVATANGLYLYDAESNGLNLILSEDIRAQTGTQEYVKDASVNLVYVADMSMMASTGDRGEFYSIAHAGFISQNVYLFCASFDLGTTVRDLIDRETLEITMQLEDDEEIILAQSVGYPEGYIPSETEEKKYSEKYSLSQNFPNPFNKSTIISYDLAEGSYITIKVYDAFGNEIEIIESSFKTAGTYETVWNPCNCPNGLYFIRLESNGSDFIRKALFLKQP